MRRSAIVALVFAGLFAPGRAAADKKRLFNNPARSYGVGAGVATDRGGVGLGVAVGPVFGIIPNYYDGFYGNGASAYGAPVPTYAPVPGTFGGSDHRVHQSPPFFGMGLGWWGKRSPSPRPAPNFEYNPPGAAVATAEPPLAGAPGADASDKADATEPPAAADSGYLIVEVRVPTENAALFVNERLTKQLGAVRTFTSPALPKGESAEYDIRAEWMVGGQKVVLTKTITGKAGERAVADFTQ